MKPLLSVEDISLTDNLAQQLFIKKVGPDRMTGLPTEQQMSYCQSAAKTSFLQAMAFMSIRENALAVADELNKEDIKAV